MAEKRVDSNELVIVQGHDHPLLMKKALSAADTAWVAGEAPTAPSPHTAKTRYRQADAACTLSKVLESEINRLIAEDHPVAEQWISDEDLAANPGLVRTMSDKPPTGTGRVRLVAIGDGASIDLQPCGGTHVRRTGEIGRVTVAKPESKGRQNRRIRLNLVQA